MRRLLPGVLNRRTRNPYVEYARRLALARSSPCGKLLAMHDELGHAVMEAIWELDNLRNDPDAAIAQILGVTDDLQTALERTRALEQEEERAVSTS